MNAPARGSAGEGGWAYIATLVLLVMVTTLGLMFLEDAGTGSEATFDHASRAQADYLAESAAHHAMWRLLYEPGFPASDSVYYMHSFAGGRYGYRVRRRGTNMFVTVSTVGVLGPAVSRQSYVLCPSARSPAMRTGTYVGDASNTRVITGVGFAPDVVLIQGRNSGKPAVLATVSMPNGRSKALAGSTALASGLVRTLEADGFGVGGSAQVNGAGKVYDWAAWKAISGEMAVGSYSGNGASDREIGGLGFTPALVIVAAATSPEPVLAFPSLGYCLDFHDAAPLTDAVLAPATTAGFRVSSGNRVNASGVTYHYVAWASVGERQACGSYPGDGADGRTIGTAGFLPEFLLVRRIGGTYDPVSRSGAQNDTTDVSDFFSGTSATSNLVQRRIAGGFEVGTRPEVNSTGATYAWFAWIRQ